MSIEIKCQDHPAPALLRAARASLPKIFTLPPVQQANLVIKTCRYLNKYIELLDKAYLDESMRSAGMWEGGGAPE